MKPESGDVYGSQTQYIQINWCNHERLQNDILKANEKKLFITMDNVNFWVGLQNCIVPAGLHITARLALKWAFSEKSKSENESKFSLRSWSCSDHVRGCLNTGFTKTQYLWEIKGLNQVSDWICCIACIAWNDELHLTLYVTLLQIPA